MTPSPDSTSEETSIDSSQNNTSNNDQNERKTLKNSKKKYENLSRLEFYQKLQKQCENYVSQRMASKLSPIDLTMLPESKLNMTQLNFDQSNQVEKPEIKRKKRKELRLQSSFMKSELDQLERDEESTANTQVNDRKNKLEKLQHILKLFQSQQQTTKSEFSSPKISSDFSNHIQLMKPIHSYQNQDSFTKNSQNDKKFVNFKNQNELLKIQFSKNKSCDLQNGFLSESRDTSLNKLKNQVLQKLQRNENLRNFSTQFNQQLNYNPDQYWKNKETQNQHQQASKNILGTQLQMKNHNYFYQVSGILPLTTQNLMKKQQFISQTQPSSPIFKKSSTKTSNLSPNNISRKVQKLNPLCLYAKEIEKPIDAKFIIQKQRQRQIKKLKILSEGFGQSEQINNNNIIKQAFDTNTAQINCLKMGGCITTQFNRVQEKTEQNLIEKIPPFPF